MTGPVTGLVIREATDADWEQLFPIFSAVVADGETYAFPEDLTSSEARGWWMVDHVVVLEDDGVILATAKMGPNRPGRGDHIGTASFMVADAARGRGVGRALGEYCVQWHLDAGFSGIQFNAVVETNEPAVHLWQALGFEIIGTVPGAFRSRTHGPVGLHVMFLPL